MNACRFFPINKNIKGEKSMCLIGGIWGVLIVKEALQEHLKFLSVFLVKKEIANQHICFGLIFVIINLFEKCQYSLLSMMCLCMMTRRILHGKQGREGAERKGRKVYQNEIVFSLLIVVCFSST